ncbi:MAG: 1-acyl-sn-glycerol-3-phosphate acyltransferase, partial [Bdellovibrio sp.]|nr:1-acyl-sn-glycerol-3-phosphate acyltransferase [Bdellovibrio sp.]
MNLIKTLFVNIRAAYRLILFAAIISVYLLNGAFYYLITANPIKRRQLLVSNARFYSKIMTIAFNMEVICKNTIPKNENSLVIGNHIGFIDIVALQSLSDCVFITSTDMKNAPGLGQICDLAGCTYVNRKNRMNIQEELKGVIQVLKEGARVVLYAESVASNGEQVLPFKKTLLMAAGFADRPIRPFVFNFREVNGGPVLYEHRDSLCWYGDENFVTAIWRSLKLNSIKVEIEFLPLVYT